MYDVIISVDNNLYNVIQSCHVITIILLKINRSCDLGLCIYVNKIVQKWKSVICDITSQDIRDT